VIQKRADRKPTAPAIASCSPAATAYRCFIEPKAELEQMRRSRRTFNGTATPQQCPTAISALPAGTFAAGTGAER